MSGPNAFWSIHTNFRSSAQQPETATHKLRPTEATLFSGLNPFNFGVSEGCRPSAVFLAIWKDAGVG